MTGRNAVMSTFQSRGTGCKRAIGISQLPDGSAKI